MRQNDLHTLVESVQRIDDRTRDLATRSDLEKLRTEIMTVMVTKDVLEPRIGSMLDRIMRAENCITTNQKQSDDWMRSIVDNAEKTHKEIYKAIDDSVKNQETKNLSDRDRTYLRINQLLSSAAIIITILGFILQHIRFN